MVSFLGRTPEKVLYSKVLYHLHYIRYKSDNLWHIFQIKKPPMINRELYDVARAGIEPATHGFSVHCSTN